MRAWPALLFVALSLAGCSSDPADTDPINGGVDGSDDIARLDAPAWAVGDWWRYQGPGSEFTLVVSEDAGSSWIIDTDDVDLAFFHAQFGPISYLGEQRKSDLAGSQGSNDVRFFDWPLEHGKTWTTTWDGESFDMVAHAQGGDSFHIQAMQDDVVINQYLYSNQTKWFEWISFGDANGTEQFRMDLLDRGSGYTGDVVRVDPQIVVADYGPGPYADINMFDVPATTEGDLYLFLQIECSGMGLPAPVNFAMGPVENILGIAAPGVLDPTDDGYNFMGQCPVGHAFGGRIGEFPDQGNWGYLLEVPVDATYDYTLWLRNIERITL